MFFRKYNKTTPHIKYSMEFSEFDAMLMSMSPEDSYLLWDRSMRDMLLSCNSLEARNCRVDDHVIDHIENRFYALLMSLKKFDCFNLIFSFS